MSANTQNVKKAVVVGGLLLFSYGIATTIWPSLSPVPNDSSTGSGLNTGFSTLVIVGQVSIYVFIIYLILTKDLHFLNLSNKYTENLNASGKALHKKDLYQNMRTSVLHANDNIYVTYFNAKSPDESKNGPEIAYQKELKRKVKAKTGITVYRIIMETEEDTEDKKIWIKKQLKLANKINNKGDHGNYEIKFLNKEITDRLSIEFPVININIFDRDCYLIDPSRKNKGDRDRDVLFISQEIANVWKEYYIDCLWENAENH